MKVEFWLVGKTKDPWVIEALEHYRKRCSHYCTFTSDVIPESRLTRGDDIRTEESGRLLTRLAKQPAGIVVLLDEKGKPLSSKAFAGLLSEWQTAGHSTFRFIIGGAYGIDDTVREQADFILSLSPMTFPHQLVRIIFLEQLYRAFTILRGEGYHH